MGGKHVEPGRAAEYLRMSGEHQRYSLEYQSAALAAYALLHGLTIVRTYADPGISGLTLARRKGLQQLLSDVVGGADFSALLVYDVSRWGRFQDPDESAHYEFICRAAGVSLHYCAEPFENDGSLASILVKSLRRAMAADFSRDLSDKVTLCKQGLGLKGYWPGGNPALGLRRSVIMGDGRQRSLEPGEANAIKGNRIVVVPGPAQEVALVRRIFRLFTSTDTTPNALARKLNAEGERTHRGQPWTQVRVRRVLANELYIGTRVVGRAQVRLGTCVRRPEDQWIRVPNATRPIISLRVFREARRRIVHHRRYTDASMLDGLRTVMREGGLLSHTRISRDPRLASPGLYRTRFGSLPAAYDLVGYTPTAAQQRLTDLVAAHRPGGRTPTPSPLTDEQVLGRLRALRDREGGLSLELIEVTPGLPRLRNLQKRFGSLERVYELSGHQPTALQRQRLSRKLAMDRAWGST